jgi:hypothetical protein
MFSKAGTRWPYRFLSKACCQHGVSRLRRARQARRAPDPGWIKDQRGKRRTAPSARPARRRFKAEQLPQRQEVDNVVDAAAAAARRKKMQ